MHSQKSVGTLLPLFSLFTNKTKTTGVIENGEIFITWLKKTGQTAWQMLPLHETHRIQQTKNHAPSPYQSYGIGLHPRFLSHEQRQKEPTEIELKHFIEHHKAWIYDYGLFCALRDTHGTDDWRLWDTPIRERDEQTLSKLRATYKETINHYIVTQWQLHNAYYKVKATAETEGIQLIGDIPFYLSITSPLVWVYQKAFLFNADFSLPRVSGVVREKKAVFGRQIWGHPLYNWNDPASIPIIKQLWQLRLSYLPTLFHMLRIDHANGFYLYGSIDREHEENDQTLTGPGEEFFIEIVTYAKKNNLHVFAEDAAVELSALRTTMEKHHIPGVRILRFAYDEESNLFEKDYLHPDSYPKESIAYTSNHDTEPLLGFMHKLTPQQKILFSEKVQVPYTTDKEFAKNLREKVINAPSLLHIIPLQDWLLTTDRINTPGTEKDNGDPNWQYEVPVPVEEYPTIVIDE